MKRKSMLTIAVFALSLAILGVSAIFAQGKDKYALTVPGGLAFSEFRGYESSGSRTAADGAMPSSTMTPRPTHSGPAPEKAFRRRGTTPSAGLRATPS
jgi:hypothetical protein